MPGCKNLFILIFIHTLTVVSSMALQGWHPGEKTIHAKMNFLGDPSIDRMYTVIGDELDAFHAEFHAQCHFLPVTTLDVDGRPWSSILAPRDGQPGSSFIRYISGSTLRVTAEVWDGEPILRTGKKNMLIAGIGIDFSTRMRNKVAGFTPRYRHTEGDRVVELDMAVNETVGNCPKYINLRRLSPYPHTHPKIAAENLHLSPDERLPDELVNFILDSDTAFFGSTYIALDKDADRFPSHLGMNQRGGRRGFIRVSKKDGRTLAMPDYSGNRILTSLGNVEATPLASLTFVNFETGAILYLTGEATNYVGEEAKQIMPMHNKNALTTLFVTGYTFVLDALPVRQTVGTPAEPSPYSPPIRFLAEEDGQLSLAKPDQMVLLASINMHSPTIATFWFRSPDPLAIKPGQAAILSFAALLGMPAYAHMAQSNPKSLNDDRIRTWTVSSSSTYDFSLTMREIPRGVITGAIFNLARSIGQSRPDLLLDTSELEIRLGFIGISGSFCLPPPVKDSETKLLWIAGGIGLTPFLGMLNALKEDTKGSRWDIHMVLSTREPEVLLPLLDAADIPADRVTFTLDLFSTEKSIDSSESQPEGVRVHRGRVDSMFWETIDTERKVYLCGPKPFEQAVLEGLASRGIGTDEIMIEGFAY
ncbi:hypothetical protein BDP27DRAFT_1283537 [Rhodocollybia butyracea]|uniref:FAD-binding FR-type domain-containing protein n=1 Tax=Rhodocollybia butyracea TaxID=206335 RepID=A0A9P5Q8D8_9AGAR|nr:hypothetical protein BDP27DRAFT_1283537 [Rhodocollybia butyracea]